MERCSKFVAHAGEELAFEPVCPLDFPVPDFELLVFGLQRSGELLMHCVELGFSLLTACDIPHNGDDPKRLRRPDRTEADLNGKLTPVLPPCEKLQTCAHRTC